MLPKQAVIIALMVAVVSIGALNNFTGRIQGHTLGHYNGVVAAVVDSGVFFFFYLTGCLVQCAAGGSKIRQQFRWIFAPRKGSNAWERLGNWKWLLMAGISDELGQLCGFIARPYLTGLMYSLMNQAIVLFTVIWSMLLLKMRYVALEVVCVCVVIAGAVSCVLVTGSSSSDGTNSLGYEALTSISTCFPALAFVLKELVFLDYEAKAPATSDDDGDGDSENAAPEMLNVFLVQALVGFVGFLAAVPLALTSDLSAFGGDGKPLTAMKDGFTCLWTGHDPAPQFNSTGAIINPDLCQHAIVAYAAYSSINMIWNLCIICLVAKGSALLTFLSMKLTVPLTAILSLISWPLIGSDPVAPAIWGILVVILFGVAGFRMGNIQRATNKGAGCCWPLVGSRSSPESENSEKLVAQA